MTTDIVLAIGLANTVFAICLIVKYSREGRDK